jgi:hypothetical protein
LNTVEFFFFDDDERRRNPGGWWAPVFVQTPDERTQLEERERPLNSPKDFDCEFEYSQFFEKGNEGEATTGVNVCLVGIT